MLTTQRNQLLDLIRREGLDPGLFTSEEPSEGRFLVRVSVKPLEFETRVSRGSFDRFSFRFRMFAPGFPYSYPWVIRVLFPNYVSSRSVNEHWNPQCSFEELKAKFSDWVARHARPAIEDATAPDLWLQAPSPFTFSAGPERPSAAGFSSSEAEQLRLAVGRFRTLLVDSYAPTPEQLTEIDERLAYLVEAVDRLNQFDWKALAAATIVGIATTLTLDTGRGRQLWALFAQALQVASKLLGS